MLDGSWPCLASIKLRAMHRTGEPGSGEGSCRTSQSSQVDHVGGALLNLEPFGIAFPYLTKQFFLGQAAKVFPLRFGSGRVLSLDY